MRLSESRLRQEIRKILKEDLAGFLRDSQDLGYFGSTYSDEESAQRADSDSLEKSRTLKKVWAANADHGFFKSLIKVHWLRAPGYQIKWFLENSGKDEVSTTGYIPGMKLQSLWGSIGVVLDGRVTLASNSMSSIVSGYHEDITDDVRKFHASSGVPKRAMFFNREAAKTFILDRASFKPTEEDNEMIVDNWKLICVALPIMYDREGLPEIRYASENARDVKRVLEICEPRGITLCDMNGDLLDYETAKKALAAAGVLSSSSMPALSFR